VSLTGLPNQRSLIINEDIDAIIARGEERTIELNSKYEGLNLEDLNNFKSDASVQQWEGEDFRAGVRIRLFSSYLVIT
jgi:SWI/SNF-related matrix-associated actin-dependent regulator of chromatin subfamily A member 5